jgi:hypothetical protein
MDPNSDPQIRTSDYNGAGCKKIRMQIRNTGTFTSLYKDKSHNTVRIQGFSYPDHAIFVIDLQDASKKLIFHTIFSASYFLKLHIYHLSKIKSQKQSQNRRNQGFLTIFA